jgi:serine/threonine protein kinase
MNNPQSLQEAYSPPLVVSAAPAPSSSSSAAASRKRTWWHNSLARQIATFVKDDFETICKQSSFLSQPPFREPALLARHEIITGLQIGKGGFAHVYDVAAIELDPCVDARLSSTQREARKRLASNAATASGHARFALKHLQPALFGTERKQAKVFARAASDLVVEGAFLSRMDHPHIVKLQALPVDGVVESLLQGKHDAYFLLLDRVDGTLDYTLQRWKRQYYQPLCSSSSNILDIKLEYALQLARALEYLHSHRIMFRDLKPHNIGLKNGSIVLLDFGLVREFLPDADMEQVFQMSGVGTRRYMAIETALKAKYNHKADIYSWSMVVWEMLSLERPYANYSVEEHKRHVCIEGERPSLDYDAWPASVCTLLMACWTESVADRLGIEQVLMLLSSIVEARKHYLIAAKKAIQEAAAGKQQHCTNIDDDDDESELLIADGSSSCSEIDWTVGPRFSNVFFGSDSSSEHDDDDDDSALSNDAWIVKHASALLVSADDDDTTTANKDHAGIHRRFILGDWSGASSSMAVSTSTNRRSVPPSPPPPPPQPLQFSVSV